MIVFNRMIYLRHFRSIDIIIFCIGYYEKCIKELEAEALQLLV